MKKCLIPPVFVFTSMILIILFYFLLPQYNWILFPYNLFGILFAYAGFVISGKSRDLFNKYKTTLGFDKSTYLITEGVFSKTRNPMYIGMFLLLFGMSICFTNIFSILTSILFIAIVRLYFIPIEEKLLYEEYGIEYEMYKKNVKRWI
jgi:protein-S-isoprenylcysteine O-methyltransferase Ste14